VVLKLKSLFLLFSRIGFPIFYRIKVPAVQSLLRF